MRRTRTATMRLGRTLRRFGGDRRGAVAIEYAILIVMITIALVGIATLTTFVDQLKATFLEIAAHLVAPA